MPLDAGCPRVVYAWCIMGMIQSQKKTEWGYLGQGRLTGASTRRARVQQAGQTGYAGGRVASPVTYSYRSGIYLHSAVVSCLPLPDQRAGQAAD